MEVRVVELANGAGHARAKKVGHEVNVMTGEMGVMGKESLV
jgi:hypothetical protein